MLAVSVMNDFFKLFVDNLQATTLLEGIAVLTGLMSVWYARKAQILVYPTGIISVLLYVYICFGAKLYADMGINGFYFAMSVYGWYMWTRKDAHRKLRPVQYCSRTGHLISLAGAVAFFLLIRYVLIHYTDSNVPNWDALTTAIFIIAMWLMALKKVEHWAWWILGDLISIPLYFSKALVLTSFQYTAFLILAIMGYVEWVKIVRRNNQAASA